MNFKSFLKAMAKVLWPVIVVAINGLLGIV